MDAFYYATPIAMPFDGANGSTTFNNYGTMGAKAIATPFGTPKISTAQSKYGGSSGVFNGTTDSLSFPTVTLSGDFTIEAWVYLTALPSGSAYGVLVAAGYGSPGLGLHNGNWVWADAGDRCLTAAVINQWVHIAMVRLNGVMNLYVNGVAGANFTQTADRIVNVIGGHAGQEFMAGYIDDLRITSGVARYTANFTPPGAIDTSGNLGMTPKALFPASKVPVMTQMSGVKVRSVDKLRFIKDMNFGGGGLLSGTVKVKGTPDYPVSRRVRLIHETSGLLVTETWSDPITGNYSFKYLRTDYLYTVISYDHTGVNRAVIANGLKPDAMP